jgi:ATP-dependent DNA helicase RecQ
MQNSAQQLANIDGSFAVMDAIPKGPVLLVDDVVESKWTLTHVGNLLRIAGCESVTPLALADNGGG